MDPVDGNRRREPEDSGGVKAGGSDPSSVGGRPGWVGLLAAGALVLVVGGFALSRDYGVQSILSPADLEEIAAPSTSSTTSPTVSVTNPEVSDSIDWDSFDWMSAISDVAVASDGLLYVVAPAGVA